MACEEWLKGILKPGKVLLCDAVREEAKKKGFSRVELKRARKTLGVKAFHQFDEDGATQNWFWYREV